MDDAVRSTIETHTAGDGYRWHFRRYVPQSSPRGHVVCLHGIQSHGGWYEHSSTRLAQAGYLVSFLDRRGSGLNQEARGDAPNFRRLIDDVAELLQHERAAQPKPVVLIGISWGGKLAVALQKRHPGLVDGVALICPGFFPQIRPGLGQRMRILWSRLTSPGRLFPIPLNDPVLFTANPKWQQFLRDDPLALHQATARLLIESVRLDGYLRWLPGQVTVPVLLLLAGRDRIIRNDATRRFVEGFAGTDKQIIEYPDAHHTLEFEPDPERFINDLRAWLDRLAARR
jgi:alpha-beta hydrolase superfamily lysophospholipase